jgi:2-polyprenyl-3-methyl-5-hydroxy-6-metoxy-1,4-benzoquinol methylase
MEQPNGQPDGPQLAEALAHFKAAQKQAWAASAPLDAFTTATAPRLVQYAGVRPGQRVLDVGCGTGVVAITAARRGARATGLDLTPALLEQAREHAATACVEVDWHEGDVEQLPFDDESFDTVLSQFGHMFAPRPDVAVAEMLRVLKPGGVIAFSTWPPELMTGRLFALIGRYAPPPPMPIAPPTSWGDPATVRERLGGAVTKLTFDRATLTVPALSPQHYRTLTEATAGPLVRLVESLRAADPARLNALCQELDWLVSDYFDDNVVRQGYLLTRATKNGGRE